MNSEPHIVIVILNTNRCEDTLDCLASVNQNTYRNRNVIVLDNSFTDHSIESIQKYYPTVQIIKLTDNLGYAGNNNVGIKAAFELNADWILVLNEDTILDPNCLYHLAKEAETDTKIGIVGPLVFHYNEPNIIQSAGGRLNKNWISDHLGQNELDRGQFSTPTKVDWISGCAIMVRRNVIKSIGMLDERFFYYYEETEWCLRALRNGWSIIHVPQAKIWHKGVQRDYRPNPGVTYYSTRNRFLMYSKHGAPFVAWLIAWQQILRTLLSWSIKPKWRSMRKYRDAMLQGVLDFFLRRWGIRS